MAIHIQAPENYQAYKLFPTVFLAGSIDNGAATEWQQWLVDELAEEEIVLLNPRRSDWNSALECDSTHPDFREQVEWELKGLEEADMIALYFAPESKAPISLLELGLFATSGRICVCCPTGYWRKGNVDIVCEQHNIKQVADLQGLLQEIKTLVNHN